MSEDNTIPRNLTDSLFRDFDLPQVSHITPKNNNKPLTLTQSKYQDAADDDFLNVQLGQNSHIVQKKSYNVPSNNSSKSKIIQQEIPIPATVSRVVTNTRAGRRKPAKKAQPERKQIDIDNEIGEIAEWAEKGAKNNSDDEQFNQAQKVGETAQQIEIKKKLSEKLKTGFNNKSKTGGGGLLAKAAQLKKQNQTKTLNSDKPFSADQLIQEAHQRIETKAIYEEHQTSTEVFMPNENTKAKPVIQNEQSEDDPWQKVNQNTLKQQNQAELKRKNMNYESVVLYYQKEFQFNEEDIEIEENNAKEEPIQEKGCFQMLFACFKDQPKKNKKSNASNNTKLAKRLIAISKKQLSNGEEEFFVLKQIWTQLTGDPFARHGSHWNKIGFQGRDPTTDLRSTGVLSILQWFIFIQNHKKLAKQYAEWSIENQFPLALTHIKITGIFLQLIEKGAIKGQNWSDFQRSYNSMAISIFKKLKSTFKGGDILGTRVQQQVKNTKKSYPKDLQVYNQQHKK